MSGLPSLSFAAPLWLALGVPLVLLVAYRLRTLPAAHAGTRRRAVQATMFLAVICAALAIARLEIASRIDRVATIFVLDRSRSVENAASDQRDESLAAIRKRPAAHPVVLAVSSHEGDGIDLLRAEIAALA